MIKALVFGQNGQLASCLAQLGKEYPDISLDFFGRSRCDIENPSNLLEVIRAARPNLVINAAAYTAVDQAESDQEAARTINQTAVRVMAEETARQGVPIVHFSTDYVFDGTATAPYCEDDDVSPLGVYGETKLAGELDMQQANPLHVIFRTSWVYSAYGKNFVKTMLNLMDSRAEIKVVNDQTGCPTSAHDIIKVLLKIVPQIVERDFKGFGTYHLVSNDPMTWWGFAKLVQSTGLEVFGPDWSGGRCEVLPITSEMYPTAAKRPGYSVLSTAKFQKTFGVQMPPVSESLTNVISELKKGYAHA